MWRNSKIKFIQGNRPLIMAHRGNSIAVPENSILAFQQAYELRVDVLETDAHLTKDNNIVFFHDQTLKRVTGEKGRIAEKTLAELKSIDLGAKFKAEDGSLPFKGTSLTIQTIEDVFNSFKEVKFNIDIKSKNPEAPKILARKLEELNAQKRVMVGSFHQKQILEFRKCSDIPTSAGPFEVVNFLKKAKKNANFSHGYHAIQVPERLAFISIVNTRNVKFAHENEIAVHVWTVNDAEKMKSLLLLGVDGIFTDNPELLIQVEKEMGFM